MAINTATILLAWLGLAWLGLAWLGNIAGVFCVSSQSCFIKISRVLSRKTGVFEHCLLFCVIKGYGALFNFMMQFFINGVPTAK